MVGEFDSTSNLDVFQSISKMLLAVMWMSFAILAVNAQTFGNCDEGKSVPLLRGWSVEAASSADRHSSRLSQGTKVELTGVSEVGFDGDWLVGVAAEKYFVIDATLADPEIRWFDDYEAWQSARASLGISTNVILMTPERWVATRPQNVTADPKRVMGGLCGLSDDGWSLAIMLLSFAIAFLSGLSRAPMMALLCFLVVLGLAVDFLAAVVISGGGPGAAAGLVALPLYCVLAGSAGRLSRRWLRARRS